MAKKSKKFRLTRKLAVILTAAVLIVAAGGLGYWHYHNRPSQVAIPVAPTKSTTAATNSSSDQSGSPSSASAKQTAPASGYGSSGGKGSGANGATGPLTPTGNFISNHYPGQNNSSTVETSVCNTTPGASCYIKFTKGNTTLQLQSGTANSSGTVYWNTWDISSYGFSSGQWTITAVSTLNGQTASAADANLLTIQ